MQPESCECDNIQLLISKYADGEATAQERQLVEAHTARCEHCACKLTSYIEMAAIFSDGAPRAAEPHLREGLFREIGRQKEEAWRKHNPPIKQQLPIRRLPKLSASGLSFAARVWRATTPFAVAAVAMLTLFYLVIIGGRLPNSRNDPTPVADAQTPQVVLPYPSYVPTSAPPIAVGDNSTIPGPVSTGVAQAGTSASVVARATVRPSIFRLAQPTPVLETSTQSSASGWHVVRDPMYGYSVYYPPNWWTQTNGTIRTFYPWVAGGNRNAPYWLDLRAQENTQRLDARSAQKVLCKGSGRVVGTRLLCDSQDSANSYQELYSFDLAYYFILRVSVPHITPPGSTESFNTRWFDVQAIFTKMDGLLSHATTTAGVAIPRQSLFLNGSDLWAVDTATKWARSITSGYGVRSFAASPDLQQVAFLSAHNSTDPWASSLYLAPINPTSYVEPSLVWAAKEIHDIAWYSDRALLAVAKDLNGVLGLYELAQTPQGVYKPRLLLELGDGMAGARGVQVSPDRQLITFLAPWGMDQGTDVYAVRPDGTDLRPLISHTGPVAPLINGQPSLAPDSQAIKSYLWATGQLTAGGYSFNILFTAGDSHSLTVQQKTSLYMAPNGMDTPIINPNQLDVEAPDKLQIMHIAYSADGKLAMTGYYNDYNYRADQLAGLWTASVNNGTLSNVRAQPTPAAPDGIADLQWSPDGTSLIYRETEPISNAAFASRYDGLSPFRIVKLDISTGQSVVLYESK